MENNENPKTDRLFADKKTLAERYGVCKRTISNWMNADILVFFRIRRVVRFDIPACDAALQQYGFTNHL